MAAHDIHALKTYLEALGYDVRESSDKIVIRTAHDWWLSVTQHGTGWRIDGGSIPVFPLGPTYDARKTAAIAYLLNWGIAGVATLVFLFSPKSHDFMLLLIIMMAMGASFFNSRLQAFEVALGHVVTVAARWDVSLVGATGSSTQGPPDDVTVAAG